MMKIVLQLFFTAGAGVAIVAFLFFYSKRDQNKDNGFFRKFPPHMTADLKVLDLGVNSYYLSGFSGDAVYLGNYTVPNRLLRVHKLLQDSTSVYVPIAAADTLWGGINVRVDSSHVYITETGKPKIRAARLDELIPRTDTLNTPGIMNVLPLHATAVVGKNYDARKKELYFFKEVPADARQNKLLLLRKAEAGIFTADGTMAYHPGAPHLFYTYFYSNRFTCIDTNLNVVYEGNTIDTFSTANLSLSSSKQNTQLTFSSTPRTVNKSAFVSDSLLFVYSNVRANNESVSTFKNNMVMDVYYHRTGKYLFSFYLPNHHNLKCSSIDIHRNVVYAVYDTYLIAFKLNLHLYRGTFE